MDKYYQTWKKLINASLFKLLPNMEEVHGFPAHYLHLPCLKCGLCMLAGSQCKTFTNTTEKSTTGKVKKKKKGKN